MTATRRTRNIGMRVAGKVMVMMVMVSLIMMGSELSVLSRAIAIKIARLTKKSPVHCGGLLQGAMRRDALRMVSKEESTVSKDDVIFNPKDDVRYMRLALRHAQHAYREKEVPIGAVLVDSQGEVIAGARKLLDRTISYRYRLDLLRSLHRLIFVWVRKYGGGEQ